MLMRCSIVVLALAFAGCDSGGGDGPPAAPGNGGGGGSGGSTGGTGGNGGSSGSSGAAGTTSFGGASGAGFGGFPGGPCPNDMDLDEATYVPESVNTGDSVTVRMNIVAGNPTSECTVQYWLNCNPDPETVTPTWHELTLTGSYFEGPVPVTCSAGDPPVCSFSYYWNKENGQTHSGGGYPGAGCAP